MSEAPRLLVADVDVGSTEELFDAVNARLTAEHTVRDTFLAAARAREKQYPTGLDFGHSQVAIPHTDPEFIIEPGLLVCRNAQATVFHAMDDPERSLDVRLSIWPLVTDPHRQTAMLAAVISILQDVGSTSRLLTADHKDLAGFVAGVLETIGTRDPAS